MNETQRQVQLARYYRNLRILVVDDFENFRLSIRQMIRAFGVDRIEVAGNGEDAVARCEHEEFDIVLCDYNLGAGKSGQQVLEELRYNKVMKHTTLFVLITAETAKDMVMGALEYLPDAYLTKPITKAVLQQRLDNLVEQREALKPINEAMDEENLDRALALIDAELKRETKYATWCLRMMASIYYRQGEYKAAYKIYEDVLGKRDIGWARLGLGKVRIAMGQYEQAIEDFTGLIRANGNLIEAYDYLAEAYLKMGKSVAAQQVLKDAVAISPHAIMRQKKLADVCIQNKDVEGAADAFRHTVRLGFNSVHEAPDNYLNLGRCLSDLSEGDSTDLGKKRAKEAVTTLERVAKKFKDNEEVQLNSLLIQSRVHQGQGDEKKSRDTLNKARSVMSEEATSPQSALELARTLYALGEESEAEQLLSDLAHNNAENKQVMAQIEDLLDEPVSLEKKVKARKLNKDGISAFESGDLAKAIEVFDEALKHTPKHPALNLNLIQVTLKQIEQQRGNPELLRRCMACLANVKHIPPQHRQHKRYLHLLKKVQELSGSGAAP
jgi:CheY-like chemotaxis protein/lipopolysaccharide biosynthesis regulator YciM